MYKTIKKFNSYQELFSINEKITKEWFDWLFEWNWFYWCSEIEELSSRIEEEIKKWSELLYVINEDWDCRISWFDYKKEEWINAWYKLI